MSILSGEQETIEHMWKCPAFASEQREIRNSIKEKLVKLNLPFADKQLPNQEDKMFEVVLEKNFPPKKMQSKLYLK